MNNFLKNNLLAICVFLTGAAVLVIEVVAIRILSPFYGNTIYTVSSVISVILIALSLGYYAGGRYSDMFPSKKRFFTIILLSGLILMALYVSGSLFLASLSKNLSLQFGPLVSSLILFLLPSLLLGALSPFAIKLQSIETPEQGMGGISGKIFFWSTLGSITGSLLTGFVLIPKFDLDQIYLSTGLLLFFLGFIPLVMAGANKKKLSLFIIVAIVLFFGSIFVFDYYRESAIYAKNGVYEKIKIYDEYRQGRSIRYFEQDKSSSGAMFLDSDDPKDLVYEYTKYYSIYRIFTPHPKNILVIGGGAYSIPKALMADVPDAEIDVCEIEPELYSLAKKYFKLRDSPNLHPLTEDGRRWLSRTEKMYDYIFSDVYFSMYSIPSHFTTQEFFATAKEKMNEGGIFVANLIGDLSRRQPSLIFSEMKTFQSVFPNSYFFAVRSAKDIGPQNIIFVGYKSDKRPGLGPEMAKKVHDPFLSLISGNIIDPARYELSPYNLLTDKYSPVEYLTSDILNRLAEKASAINGDELLSIVGQQLRYGPRYLETAGHEKEQDFLIAEMKALTGNATVQSWDHEGSDKKIYGLKNVIGRLRPEKKTRVILATHYDSKNRSTEEAGKEDLPVPGANDSASGVAVLIELARKFSQDSREIDNVGIDFVFFDGEEGELKFSQDSRPFEPIGSNYFAHNLSRIYPEDKPLFGIVIDMVCDKDLVIHKERSSFESAGKISNDLWSAARKINKRVFQDDVKYNIVDDHTPLNKAGIPSVLLIDFDYPFFHTTGDTLDKCSAESLRVVAETLFNYLKKY
jgi:spermidine synthase